MGIDSRFLRARKWDIDAAYTQFHDTETWRQANELDTLYETIDCEAYNELRRLVCHVPRFRNSAPLDEFEFYAKG